MFRQAKVMRWSIWLLGGCYGVLLSGSAVAASAPQEGNHANVIIQTKTICARDLPQAVELGGAALISDAGAASTLSSSSSDVASSATSHSSDVSASLSDASQAAASAASTSSAVSPAVSTTPKSLHGSSATSMVEASAAATTTTSATTASAATLSSADVLDKMSPESFILSSENKISIKIDRHRIYNRKQDYALSNEPPTVFTIEDLTIGQEEQDKIISDSDVTVSSERENALKAEQQILPENKSQVHYQYLSDNLPQSKKCQWDHTLRVAIAQDGESKDTDQILRQMLISLTTSGHYIYTPLLNQNLDFSKPDNYYQLALQSQNGCILLLPDGMYNGNWSVYETEREFNRLKQRIVSRKDVDMVWAFGDTAAEYLADSKLEIPILVINADNAEASGLVGPGEFSNIPNVHVQKEHNRYWSEIRMFHDLFQFKRLGVIIDSDPKIQLSLGMDAFVNSGRKLGFDLNICSGRIVRDTKHLEHQELLKAHRESYDVLRRCAASLSLSSDAVYIASGFPISDEFYRDIKILIDREIPIFSQSGDEEVKRGALMSCAESFKEGAGVFEANVVRDIYSGEQPDHISQYYNSSLYITFNMLTAQLIGWRPSFEFLIAVDKAYHDIQGPNEHVVQWDSTQIR